jgi:hypothetical protein
MASPIDLKITASIHENCGHGLNFLRPTTLAEDGRISPGRSGLIGFAVKIR